MDPKEDKNLWDKQYLEDVGEVLLVEESYYDAMATRIAEANQTEEAGIEQAWEALKELLEKNLDEITKSGREEVIQKKQDQTKIATYHGAQQAYEMVMTEMEKIKAHFANKEKEES